MTEREARQQKRDAETESARVQLEGELKHYRELYEALKREHTTLQSEGDLERQRSAAQAAQAAEKAQKQQVELERGAKELALEREKAVGLSETIERLQNDTTELDGLRRVLGDQMEEAERQSQAQAEMLATKEEELRVAGEGQRSLAATLKAREETLGQRDAEMSGLQEKLELSKRQGGQLVESLQEAKAEKAQLERQLAEGSAAKEGLASQQAELRRVNGQLQEAAEQQRLTATAELAQRTEQLRRKTNDWEQIRRALESEQRELAAAREQLVRAQAQKDVEVQATGMREAMVSNLEVAHAELKKFNMSVMESSKHEREELTNAVEVRDQRLQEKDAELGRRAVELERGRSDLQQVRDEHEAFKREAALREEMATLKGAMTQQEVQLQVKQLEHRVEQQEATLATVTGERDTARDELGAAKEQLEEEAAKVRRLTAAADTMKRDNDTETVAVRDLLAAKTAELEKMERRTKEEIALLEVKFEEERRGFSRLVRQATSNRLGGGGGADSPLPQSPVVGEHPGQPQVTEEDNWLVVPQVRGQAKDWALAFQGDEAKAALNGEFEREFVRRVVERAKVPLFSGTERPRSPREVLYPAHLLGVAFTKMLQLEMEATFQSMLGAATRAIGITVNQKVEDLPVLCFWLSNCIELRSVVHTLQGVDQAGQDIPLPRGTAKVNADLGQLLTEIFQMAHKKIRGNIVRNVPGALLQHDPLQSTSGFGGSLRLFGGRGPTPLVLTQQLMEVKNLVAAYCLDAHTTNYLFSFILYTIGTEALSTLLLKKDLCNPRRGLGIRLNLNTLEEWCKREGFPEAVLHLQPLAQAAGLLQQPLRTTQDIEQALDTCFLLNSSQVHKLLANFRDDMDQPVRADILRVVYERTLDAPNESLLEQNTHAPFERPPTRLIHMLERYVPPGVQMADLLQKLGESPAQ